MTTALLTIQNNLWPLLHASSEADAVFITAAELERIIADRLGDLAMDYSIYVVRDNDFITLVESQGVYDLPPRHLSTISVALNDSPLDASSTAELEMRDADYQTTEATADRPIARWYEDKQGFNMVGVHPVPAAADEGDTLEVIYHRYPCEVDEGVEGPLYLGDLLELLTGAGAYGRESDFCMPEVAKSMLALASVYTDAMMNLYGSAQ